MIAVSQSSGAPVAGSRWPKPKNLVETSTPGAASVSASSEAKDEGSNERIPRAGEKSRARDRRLARLRTRHDDEIRLTRLRPQSKRVTVQRRLSPSLAAGVATSGVRPTQTRGIHTLPAENRCSDMSSAWGT